ncbi:UNKNOWN [Stylonychia lemnae]|uniref:Uncharacterized protein n=1 Tax=Stylonychia lemnae TaxID=5949 RepID=A0A078AKJ5_STYLE|nr:UNKNOWN [Stylonychia lemnae]|eukprot:CDW82739.1 UNKNOWN [Stylonychia lemnae]
MNGHRRNENGSQRITVLWKDSTANTNYMKKIMSFANSAVSCKNEVSIRKLVTFSSKKSDRPYSSQGIQVQLKKVNLSMRVIRINVQASIIVQMGNLDLMLESILMILSGN